MPANSPLFFGGDAGEKARTGAASRETREAILRARAGRLLWLLLHARWVGRPRNGQALRARLIDKGVHPPGTQIRRWGTRWHGSRT